MKNRSLWLLLVLLPFGCKVRPEPSLIVKPSVDQVTQELPVAGPWSEPQNGVRCRILLDRKTVNETSILLASLAIENTAAQSIALTGSGAPPFGPASVAWRADDQAMIVDVKAHHGEPATATLSLAPGETYVTEPVRLLVPAGVGPRELSASMPTMPFALVAAPITVQIMPADWGKPVNGLMFRLGVTRPVYTVAQAAAVQFFIYNMTEQPIAVSPPDWSGLSTDMRDDLILIHVSGDKELVVHVPPGGVWTQPVLSQVLLAPGAYRLRLTFDCPEQPAGAPAAWNGTATTNDLTVEVRAP